MVVAMEVVESVEEETRLEGDEFEVGMIVDPSVSGCDSSSTAYPWSGAILRQSLRLEFNWGTSSFQEARATGTIRILDIV